MATFTYTIPDANFADAQPALGTDVRSRDNQIRTFILGSNLDPTDNINVTVAYPWTARHSWTVSDANNDNTALTVGAVMAANKYGYHAASSSAQINSALHFLELTNASSTVAVSEVSQAGTGSGYKATHTNTGSAFEGNCSSTSNTAGVSKLTQAGTGPLISGTLRTLANLNSVFLAAKQTTVYTVSNSSTETVDTDLTVTLPANFLKAGTTIRGKVYGVIAPESRRVVPPVPPYLTRSWAVAGPAPGVVITP